MGVVRLSDILDILVVTSLVYGAIFLLKKTHSLFVVLGIAILSLVYITATILNLYLTAIVFQAFFGIFLIALVIIFQGELRKFFELVALWGSASWRGRNQQTTKPEYVENIVHTAERLAREKVGMLLVMAGRESFMRHLQGGFDLGGKISEPLLLSIFDASSPGHDGAVIVEGDIITKFGVHLPLSKDFHQIKHYGTRHSAALGIAEVSDALALIVSEEQGRISIARNGKLHLIEDVTKLEGEIEKFLQSTRVFQPQNFWPGILTTDVRNKFLALLISVLAWLLFVWPYR
jgi:uncharacterized protein (TIGR00159 family)